jgi:hypothetical protein
MDTEHLGFDCHLIKHASSNQLRHMPSKQFHISVQVCATQTATACATATDSNNKKRFHVNGFNINHPDGREMLLQCTKENVQARCPWSILKYFTFQAPDITAA